MEPGTRWPLGGGDMLPAAIFVSPFRATPAKLNRTCPEAARAVAVRAVSANAAAVPARNDRTSSFHGTPSLSVSVCFGGASPFY